MFPEHDKIGYNEQSNKGASTTHFNKLLPKVEGGGAGGCPLLVVTIDVGTYIAQK